MGSSRDGSALHVKSAALKERIETTYKVTESHLATYAPAAALLPSMPGKESVSELNA